MRINRANDPIDEDDDSEGGRRRSYTVKRSATAIFPIYFYFMYRNERVVGLPITPQKFTVRLGGNNQIAHIINKGEINLLKNPKLDEISFEGFIPWTWRSVHLNPHVAVLHPLNYVTFFTNVREAKEFVNFVITGLNISMSVSIEDFSYSWDAPDLDMMYSLTLKRYRVYTGAYVLADQPTTPTQATEEVVTARENVSKNIAVGEKVLVNGRLYGSSTGLSPSVEEKNSTRTVHLIDDDSDAEYPIHLISSTTGQSIGWVSRESVEVLN